MRKAYTYYRVSTERQGQSGLGLEAQQIAVREYAKSYDLVILLEFTEVESGKKNSRPVLAEALELCLREGAILLIAKLDRLGRNVAFISKLMESNVDFVAVDNPKANKLILHIMAAFAEYERDQISKRTKEALAAAKRKGIQLGIYGKEVLSKSNKAGANYFACKMKPIIARLNRQGFKSVRKITLKLNENNILPYTGKGAKWHSTTVYKLLVRIKKNHPNNVPNSD